MSPPSDEEILTYLESLPAAELARRVVRLSKDDRAAWFGLGAEAQAATGVVDVAALRREISAGMRVSGYLDWRRARDYSRKAEAILGIFEGLLGRGQSAAVVELCEHVIARLDKAMAKIDDSGGHLGYANERVETLHLEACRAARPDPVALGRRLVKISLGSDWEWFLDGSTLYADVLGEAGLAAYRRALMTAWDALPPLLPGDRRHGRREENRFIITHLRENLAKQSGDIDELVSVLAHDTSSAYPYYRIAEVLEDAGREREAKLWMERGVQAYPPAGDDSRPRGRLVAAYLRDGQEDDALALVERQLVHAPNATSYAELRRLASDLPGWPARRASALDLLRAADPSSRNRVVEALLGEDAIEDAWHEAVEGGCGVGNWERLADLRRETHPDDALPIYHRMLDKALQTSHEGAYREVIRLLSSIEIALTHAGRQSEFASLITDVRETNRRRPKFISMLTERGWDQQTGGPRRCVSVTATLRRSG